MEGKKHKKRRKGEEGKGERKGMKKKRYTTHNNLWHIDKNNKGS